ncbi:hypothetical protein TOPH_01291 [Tolypocladium ophioglossoides CBS 100239]|uniref:Uncharacterized protein n=1 Tax=Tolypocladium ophioglossoides (strain CBS 100239) TaxID=1163406 RepID=A0A0L0NJR5_TOLOC|nr:hypothetical protein TOPH_01291 [Tolypocladium ophioglossoides CBS 100239]
MHSSKQAALPRNGLLATRACIGGRALWFCLSVQTHGILLHLTSGSRVPLPRTVAGKGVHGLAGLDGGLDLGDRTYSRSQAYGCLMSRDQA